MSALGADSGRIMVAALLVYTSSVPVAQITLAQGIAAALPAQRHMLLKERGRREP